MDNINPNQVTDPTTTETPGQILRRQAATLTILAGKLDALSAAAARVEELRRECEELQRAVGVAVPTSDTKPVGPTKGRRGKRAKRTVYVGTRVYGEVGKRVRSAIVEHLTLHPTVGAADALGLARALAGTPPKFNFRGAAGNALRELCKGGVLRRVGVGTYEMNVVRSNLAPAPVVEDTVTAADVAPKVETSPGRQLSAHTVLLREWVQSTPTRVVTLQGVTDFYTKSGVRSPRKTAWNSLRTLVSQGLVRPGNTRGAYVKTINH